MTTSTVSAIGKRQRVINRLCGILESDKVTVSKTMLVRLNNIVTSLNQKAGIKAESNHSDTSIVGGEVMTMLYSPDFSPAFRMSIQENHNGGDNEQYSVSELSDSYLDPLGSNYGELSKDSHDFTVLTNIKEDYIIFS